LKRHGYYCRSRKAGDQAIRSRACIPCARAKARCDNHPIACTRCTSKGIHCEYRSRRTRDEEEAHEDSPYEELQSIHDTPALSGHSTSTSPEAAQPLFNLDAGLTDANNVSSSFDTAQNIQDPFGWDILDITPPKLQALAFYASPGSLVPVPYDSSALGNSFQYTAAHVTPTMQAASMPTMPPYAMRCFTGKSAFKGNAQVTASMMKRILTAYPVMMRGQGSSLPFIHSSFLTSTPATDRGPSESLTTCASLMQMLGSGGETSKKLVWRNVRLECDRLHTEVSCYLLFGVPQLTRVSSGRISTGENYCRPCKHF
jgi:hypothetical protein